MDFSKYTNLYEVQKTLKFELRPIGRSMENIEKYNFFEKDRILADNYPVVKSLIDRYHRKFINSALEKYHDDWTELDEAIDNNRNSKPENRDKNRKELDRIKKEYRKRIRSCFKADDRFDKIRSKKIFGLIKNEMWDSLSEEEKSSFEVFEDFGTYFNDLHKNRENIYSEEPKASAISFRIVDQNYLKFHLNCFKFKKLVNDHPDILVEIEKELGDVTQYFEIDKFNSLLNQTGIDHYNEFLGGVAVSEREHKKGLNQILNEYHQKNPETDKVILQKLFKLILSEQGTSSFVPDFFESDSEVLESVAGFIQELSQSNTLHDISVLFNSLAVRDFDFEKIYVSSASLSSISQSVYDRWDPLESVLRSYYEKTTDLGRTKIDKLMSSKQFNLSDISKAIVLDDPGRSLDPLFKSILSSVDLAQQGLLKAKELKKVSNVRSESGSVVVRSILEPLIDLIRDMKSFSISGEVIRDESFYQEFDSYYEYLFSAVRLYNKVRNYCTKKEYDTDKIKMKFCKPTLANGWSVSKEEADLCILFRKQNNYYLGILNPFEKVDFSQINSSDSGDFYEKMDYYYVADPVKMLPKIFIFAESWKNLHPVPDEILNTYLMKRDKKISEYPPGFETKLIRYYQECIRQYPNWSDFNFKFKKPEDYKNLDEFCKSVTLQGYIKSK